MSSDLALSGQDDKFGDETQSSFGSASQDAIGPLFFQNSLTAPLTAADSASTTASNALVATTSAAASGINSSTGAPTWIASLHTASLAADMAAADVNGVVTEAGLAKILTDLDATLSSTSTLTTNEFADLKTIAANLNNGVSTSGYLTYVFNALVNGNAANATWVGGDASSVALGDLAVGSNATQLAELTGKWFLGTDLPSSTVSMSGFSPFDISYAISAGPLFGAAGPKMSDVNQGDLGDCYFLSSCAEVANQDASIISSMFTNNGNGTYGVRFYVDGVADYVTVNASLAGGGDDFNQASDIWASLAEKAYAQFQTISLETGNSVNYGNSYSTIGNGGDPADALEALTGASAFADYYASGSSWTAYGQNASLAYTSETGDETSANVLTSLLSDLAARDDVILDSNTDATDSSGRITLVADHAMSIYGYDSSTGMLEIRNPWGSEAGQNWDTTFEVSLSTLLSDGDSVTADNAGTGASSNDSSQQVAVTVHANNIALSGGVTGPYNFIDLLNLEASYGDLISAFGTNEQAMQNWYNAREPIEQRPDTFDGLDYVASYNDLIAAFKGAGSEQAVLDAGATHFITHGVNEGRATTFNGLDYIASYGDLIKAFGVNGDAGALHYIEYGASEGRTTTFDGLDYIASYGDLAKAFGANEQAGAAHFIQYGYSEGRATTFDGLDYIAGYTDLMTAFGANNDAGATHYIDYGLGEGRTADAFNVAAYESAHPDLIGKYANNDAFLTAYIDNYVTTGKMLT